MRITELARRAGVRTSTVRYYERSGLLAEPARTHGGYRDYDDEAVTTLRFLRRGQQLGFTLAELAAFTALSAAVRGGAISRDEVDAVAQAKLREIEARIEDLRRTRDALAGLLEAECLDPDAACPVVAALGDLPDATAAAEPRRAHAGRAR